MLGGSKGFEMYLFPWPSWGITMGSPGDRHTCMWREQQCS